MIILGSTLDVYQAWNIETACFHSLNGMFLSYKSYQAKFVAEDSEIRDSGLHVRLTCNAWK